MARWLEVPRRTPSDYGTFKTMKCGCCLRGTDSTAYWIRPTRKSLHKDKTRTNYWTADCSEARKSFQNEPKTGEQNNSGETIYHTSLAPSINIPASAVSCFCHGNKSEYPDPATSWGLMNKVMTTTKKNWLKKRFVLQKDLSVFIILNITDVVNTHSSCCNVYKNEEFPSNTQDQKQKTEGKFTNTPV